MFITHIIGTHTQLPNHNECALCNSDIIATELKVMSAPIQERKKKYERFQHQQKHNALHSRRYIFFQVSFAKLPITNYSTGL